MEVFSFKYAYHGSTRPKTSVPWTVVVRNIGQSGLDKPEMWRSFGRLTPADQVVVLV